MKKLMYLAVLAALFSACTNGGRKAGTDDVEDATAQGLTWDSVTFRTNYKVPGIGEGEYQPNMDLDIAFLTTTGDTELERKIDQNLARFFFNEEGVPCKDFIKTYADSILQSYKEEVEQMYDPNEEYPMILDYEWYESGNLLPDGKDGIIAYEVAVSTYTGGAHGSHNLLYLNMDAKTGKLLGEDDVFTQEFKNEGPKLMEKRLMEMYECETKEQLMEDCMILMLGDAFVSDNNFALLKDSVMFNFNEYEIAPYAVGNVQLKLAYKDIEKYLKWK